MRKPAFIAMLLTAVWFAVPAYGASPAQEAAYRLVKAKDMGQSLPEVAWSLVGHVDTYAKIVKAVGESEGKRLIDAELAALRPSYQERWNRDLANAYAKFFTAQELDALAAPGQGAAQVNNVERRIVLAGHELASSESLVRAYLVEALDKAYARTKGQRSLPISAASATPEQDAAQTYVQRQNVGKNLMSIAWMVIIDAKSYLDIKKKLGNTEAQEMVTRELEAVRGPYQTRWNRNLVNAYAKHFTVAELKSLAAEGEASRYAGKLREKQYSVLEDMQATSEDVLHEFVAQGLTNASAVAATAR